MTIRRTQPDPPDRDPLLSDAENEAVGRRIQELALTVDAPPALRARLAEAERARPRRARAWSPAGRPRLALGAAATGLAAVIAVVVVLAGGGGGAAAPSVADAAALALAGPTAGAPPVDTRDVSRVGASVDGIAFPNYSYIWPAWKTSGARHDHLSGRDATTVVYRGPQGDVGYTIIGGKPLPQPAEARDVITAGLKLKVYRRDGATVVTWRRDGHTCVLAGRGANVEPQLVKFATWA